MLRSLFLLGYLIKPDFRREVHRLLSQGELVHLGVPQGSSDLGRFSEQTLRYPHLLVFGDGLEMRPLAHIFCSSEIRNRDPCVDIDKKAFRGFALADPIAPFVVINDQDAKTAWSFTLLHELAHLWLGATGVSGAYAEGQLERFCNDVASNFLLPDHELQLVGVGRGVSPQETVELITAFANDRLLSRSLVTYRLFRAGSISYQ